MTMVRARYAINKVIIVHCTTGSNPEPLILRQIIEICILVKMRVKNRETGRRGLGGRIIVGNLAKETSTRFSLLIFKFHFTWDSGGACGRGEGSVTEPRLTN
jgi:hypothetical protein